MRFKIRASVFGLVCFMAAALFFGLVSHSYGNPENASKTRFELSFPSSVHEEAITGRVFVMVTRNEKREPRLQAGSWSNSVPFFGLDVHDLAPGESGAWSSTQYRYVIGAG